MTYLHTHVKQKMEEDFGLKRESIPSADAPAHCEVFLSNDYAERENLLVLVATKRDTPPGIWSRGLCLSHGLDVGSMLPVIKVATAAGYGVVVLNPKKNSVSGMFEEIMYGSGQTKEARKVKLRIEGSSTAEEHIVTVWDKFLEPSKVCWFCSTHLEMN